MKGMNSRNSIEVFRVIAYSPLQDLLKFLEAVTKVGKNAGMTVELGYSHLAEKSKARQGIVEITKMIVRYGREFRGRFPQSQYLISAQFLRSFEFLFYHCSSCHFQFRVISDSRKSQEIWMMSLYSLRFWWKVPVRCASQLTRNREGTLKPLSSSVFEALRGCLNKNRPLNFARKIILPETLASERLYRDYN